jgi:hypothetical protein
VREPAVPTPQASAFLVCPPALFPAQQVARVSPAPTHPIFPLALLVALRVCLRLNLHAFGPLCRSVKTSRLLVIRAWLLITIATGKVCGTSMFLRASMLSGKTLRGHTTIANMQISERAQRGLSTLCKCTQPANRLILDLVIFKITSSTRSKQYKCYKYL